MKKKNHFIKINFTKDEFWLMNTALCRFQEETEKEMKEIGNTNKNIAFLATWNQLAKIKNMVKKCEEAQRYMD